MSLTPEARYFQLGQHIAEMPDFAGTPVPLPPRVQQWLGRACALVEAGGMSDSLDAADLNVAAGSMENPQADARRAIGQRIALILYRVLARAELNAPAVAKGAFIPAGNVFDAHTAVGNVVGEAKADVLLVDPYADEKLLTDYAVQVPEKVAVRVLTDAAHLKLTLEPAMTRWHQQHGQDRPLEIRVATVALHDRLIVVDDTTAWTLGQSFKDLAVKAPTTISRTPPEVATLKIDAYKALWLAASPLV